MGLLNYELEDENNQVSVTVEKMAQSTFGQESKTAKELKDRKKPKV